MNEWFKSQALLNMLVKALWERNSRYVDRKKCTPKNVVHISANIDPSSIRLDDANESKIKFLASGSRPLEHSLKMKLTASMEKAAGELHNFLPVIIGLAIQSTLTKITDEERLNVYDGVLAVDGDEREGRHTHT